MSTEKRNVGVRSCGSPSLTEYSRGCRCDACRRCNTTRRKKYKLEKLRGTHNALVDPTRTREKLVRLQSLGYTDDELKNLGIEPMTAYRIRNGLTKRVLRSTEQKILSISERRPTRHQRVDATKAAALVSSWFERGVSIGRLAKALEVSRPTVDRLLRFHREGGGKVSAETAFKVARHAEDVESLMAAPPPDRGDERGWSYTRHLSDWEVEEAACRKVNGESIGEIAADYGVSSPILGKAVSDCVRRRESGQMRLSFEETI